MTRTSEQVGRSTGAYWLGTLPEGWSLLPGRRVISISKEIPGEGSSQYERLSLTMQGVLPRRRDDNEGLQPTDFNSYQLVRPDQLIFKLIDLANVATSRVGLSPSTGLVSPAYIIVTCGPRLVPKFAYYYFYDLYLRRVFNALGGDGVRSALGPRDLRSLPIPVPPVETQVSIADFLDREVSKIDSLVAKQRSLIETLVERRDATRDNHFVSIEGKRRTTVKRVLEPLARPAVSGLGVVTAYRDGVVTLRSKRREEGYTFSDSQRNYQEVRPGDLVFHALDGFAGAVGISDSRGVATPVYHVCQVVSDDVPEYVALLLRYLGTSGLRATQAPNVRQRSVDFRNWQTFGRVPLALPSRSEQQAVVHQIDEQTEKVERLVCKAHGFIALAMERRTALIAAAVAGELNVSGLAA